MNFYIRPGMQDAFESAFLMHFEDCYRLLSRDQVFAMKLFGTGTPHPHIERFLGDYLAVATGGTAISSVPPSDGMFRAAHAGITADEMRVPLIVCVT